MFFTTLPLELWFIIIDMAASNSFSLHMYCNPHNFADSSLHLRFPWRHRRTTNLGLRNIRLVCRAFYMHLKSPTYFFVEENWAPIPLSTSALYIDGPCAQDIRLKTMSGDFNSHRIITLDIQTGDPQQAPQIFADLCKCADAFSGVRNLAFGGHHYPPTRWPIPRFWDRLNDAYPRLVSLVLRGGINATEEVSLVTFKELEILDLDLVYLPNTVHFAVLRHAAFSHMPSYRAHDFTGWSLLESLLFPAPFQEPLFDWSMPPNLRVLGLQCTELNSFAQRSQQHHLIHLFVYVGVIWGEGEYFSSSKSPDHQNHQPVDLTWMKLITERIPTIARTTFGYERTTSFSRSVMSCNFDEEEVNALGFSIYHPSDGRCDGGVRIIMGRTRVASTVIPEEEESVRSPTKQGTRWNRFKSWVFSA